MKIEEKVAQYYGIDCDKVSKDGHYSDQYDFIDKRKKEKLILEYE